MLIIWHFSSSLNNPTPGYILQTSMFSSPKKSFLLPVYAQAIACASPPTRPRYIPRYNNVGDPRVLEFLEITTNVDASFPIDCSKSKSSSLSSEIFQCKSSKSRPCNDDSMSQSS